jgi:Matrixin/Putative Ig domain
LLLFATIESGAGYRLEDHAWPVGSKVTIRLGLGPTTLSLEDGFGSWNASAADALAIWNGYLDLIHVSAVSSSTVPQRSGDGYNSVFFSNTIFGDSFGADTLAVTVLLDVASRPGTLREADVVVNSAYRYNSYRGPLHSGAVYDFHRILLHEFGHVLGLDHDTTYPLKTKIMEPVISDWDHLGADDIDGMRSLYGASFYYPSEPLTLRIQYFFIWDIYPNNHPTSFSAIGLPPGLVLNPYTGRIIGTPTRSGLYNTVITAHGPIANAYVAYQFTVLGLEQVPGLLKIFSTGVTSLVADPIRPRVFFSNPNGINVINTQTLAVTNLLAAAVPRGALSISADASTLLSTSRIDMTSMAHEVRVELNSLSALPTLTIQGSFSPVLEGLNNQAYILCGHAVCQFDASTGELQQSFSEGQPYAPLPGLALSPDRQTLYVTHANEEGSLSIYDVSTANPVLVKQLPGSYLSLTPSSDGRFLFYIRNDSTSYSLVRANLPGLSSTRSIMTSDHFLGTTAIAPDGFIYQSVFTNGDQVGDPSGWYALYDPVTLQHAADIQLGNLQTGDSPPYLPLDVVFDSAGKYCFANVQGEYGGEVWMFSSNVPSLPPITKPTKNLINISTRGRVEAGEDAMIGGFIIQGTKAKKVAIRGLGPSLPVTGALDDPYLELYDSTGKRITFNDNWTSNRLNIIGSLLAPSSPRESTLLVTLQPGAYTAVVRDYRNQPGVALMEVYDVDLKDSKLANISTRGKVGTGDNVLIGGFIVGGADPAKVIIRAIGPSLAHKGIGFPLADPVLELHDGTGKLIYWNDNWRTAQASAIVATGIPPTDNREAAMLLTLRPGNYTAIVRGKGGATGVALVEVYNLDSSASAN